MSLEKRKHIEASLSQLHPQLRDKLMHKISYEGVLQIPIFVVDDNKYFPIFISNHLKKLQKKLTYYDLEIKFTVKKYYNGKDCLKNLHHQPEIIFLDYYLDQEATINAMNGDKVFMEIKSKFPEIKVVMLCTRSSFAELHHLAKEGLKQVLIKDDGLIENIDHIIFDHFEAKKKKDKLM